MENKCSSSNRKLAVSTGQTCPALLPIRGGRSEIDPAKIIGNRETGTSRVAEGEPDDLAQAPTLREEEELPGGKRSGRRSKTKRRWGVLYCLRSLCSSEKPQRRAGEKLWGTGQQHVKEKRKIEYRFVSGIPSKHLTAGNNVYLHIRLGEGNRGSLKKERSRVGGPGKRSRIYGRVKK